VKPPQYGRVWPELRRAPPPVHLGQPQRIGLIVADPSAARCRRGCRNHAPPSCARWGSWPVRVYAIIEVARHDVVEAEELDIRVDPKRAASAVRPGQRKAAVDRDIGEGTVAAPPEGGGKDYSRLSNLPKARTQADRDPSELSKCVARRPAMVGKTPSQCRQAQDLKGRFCHKVMD
jgi:hypothetical protein